ncbi:hypothetical protein [Kitasatospora sp. NPDC085879]|uniref:hypothetical protein n=1 Tax=Kitasatospora sp. NPDC085879 TaxID=3154769 RepID=UPI003427ABB3
MADCDELQVASLDPENDDRVVTVQVAGHAALLIAKAFKIKDRPSDPKDDRRPDRDAADVVRITTVAGGISATFGRLAGHPRVVRSQRKPATSCSTSSASPRSPGAQMAVQALAGDMPEERVRLHATSYTTRYLA